MTVQRDSSPASIDAHTVEANGLGLHYLVAGTGPPVVLLHGWPQHSHHWRRVMPALAERCTVIAPDLRGAGGSSKPIAADYSKRELAKDVRALVEMLFGEAPIGICGYDHGGGVGYQYASMWPDGVERFAFLEFALPGFGYEHELQPRRGWDDSWHIVAFTVPEICERFFVGRERDLLAWYFHRFADKPYAVSTDDFEVYVRTLQVPNALRAGMQYFAAVWDDMDHNREAAATPLTMPVLAVGGERGIGVHVEESISQVAEDVRGVLLPGAGHWLSDERPDELGAVLLDFFSDGVGGG